MRACVCVCVCTPKDILTLDNQIVLMSLTEELNQIELIVLSL